MFIFFLIMAAIILIFVVAKKHSKKQNYSPKYKIEIKKEELSTRSFHSKIAGVTHKNEDGTNRQEIIKRCKPGEKLKLVHSPIPQHENAVKVLRENGEQLGWLKSGLGDEIAPLLDKGMKIEAHITEITGGGNKSYGCNILITKYLDS